MKTSVKKFLIFVFAGAVYLAGQFLLGDWMMGTSLDFICHPYQENGRTYCHSLYLDEGFSLIAAAQMLAVAGIILLFANARALRNWLWMSVVYLPLAAIMVIWYTPTAPCIFMCAPPDYENMTRNFGYLYILITLGIVLTSWWRSRKLTA